MKTLNDDISELLSKTNSIMVSRNGNIFIARTSIQMTGYIAPMGQGATAFDAMQDLILQAKNVRRVYEKCQVNKEEVA